MFKSIEPVRADQQSDERKRCSGRPVVPGLSEPHAADDREAIRDGIVLCRRSSKSWRRLVLACEAFGNITNSCIDTPRYCHAHQKWYHVVADCELKWQDRLLLFHESSAVLDQESVQQLIGLIVAKVVVIAYVRLPTS